MSSDNNNRITIDFWTRKTGKPISEEDARQINANLSGFFRVLCEWDERDRNYPVTSKNEENGHG